MCLTRHGGGKAEGEWIGSIGNMFGFFMFGFGFAETFCIFRALVYGAGAPAGFCSPPKIDVWILRALVSGAGAPAGAFCLGQIAFSNFVYNVIFHVFLLIFTRC